MNKKIFALVLALLMALSLMPISTMAATSANSFTVTLEWDEETIRQDHIANYRPDTVTLQLVCNGKNYGDPVDINTTPSDPMLISISQNCQYTFENLPTVDQNDNPCNYTVKVVNPDADYHFCITESNHYSATLTATVLYFDYDVELYCGYTSASNIADAEFTIYSDEECTKAIASAITVADYYDYAYADFTNLTAGTYYIKHTKAAPGYALVDDVFEITLDDDFNFEDDYLEVDAVPAATIVLTKEWDDNNNAGNARPDSISVQLLADGENYREPLTLTAKDGWKLTVDDLPALRITNTGYEPVSYSVKEDNVATDYTASYEYSIEEEKNFGPVCHHMNYNGLASSNANLIVVEDYSTSISTYKIWTEDVLTEAEQQKVLTALINDGAPEDTSLYSFVSGTDAFNELYLRKYDRYIYIVPIPDTPAEYMKICAYMYYGFNNKSSEKTLSAVYHWNNRAEIDADIIIVGHEHTTATGYDYSYDIWSKEELPEDFQQKVLDALIMDGAPEDTDMYNFVFGEDAFKELNMEIGDSMIYVQSLDEMDWIAAFMYIEVDNNLYAITDITITNTYTGTIDEVAEEETDDNKIVSPNTGDNSNVILYAALSVLSIAAAAVILPMRMRRKNNG